MMHWPEAFLSRTAAQLGPEQEAFLAALETEAPVSVRINYAKIKSEIQAEPVGWSNTGYYLPSRPLFTADPLLHAGAYYVQEAGSMFIEQAFKQHLDTGHSLRVLDLCAAPGGKSTHILNLISDESLLVSNEVIRSRAGILRENITKWGKANVIVSNNDPKDFSDLKGYFDVIVVDAPCSGEGLFRKDPKAAEEWSEDNVKLCSLRQQRILHDIWPALKAGGLLIYSTCTYEPSENEEQAEAWIRHSGAQSLRLQTRPEWGVTETETGGVYSYRFYPHKTKSEGFFCTLIQKAGTGSNTDIKLKPAKLSFAGKATESALAEWLAQGTNWDILQHAQYVSGFPKALSADLALLKSRLNLVSAGTDIAEQIKDKFQPLHAFALSTALAPDAFESIELTAEDAIRYLRKDDIKLPAATTQGIVLLRYKGVALGFGKWLGNRLNNYYPKEWRILKQITADQYFSLIKNG